MFSSKRNYLSDKESVVIYSQSKILSSKELEGWQSEAVAEFLGRVDEKSFPCLFARKAALRSKINFLFCQTKECLLYGLIEYTEFVKKTDIKERFLSPLVVFFSDALSSQSNQLSFGWKALNWVHLKDPCSWPTNIPKDPENPNWSFCFNELQLFINMSSPEHKLLKNRNLGKYLTFIINPRENFDHVASLSTKSGRLVRAKIRSKVASYIDDEVPKELGFFGDGKSKEWKQYQLSEDEIMRPVDCPFNPKK